MGIARPVAARRERMMATVFILTEVVTLERRVSGIMLYIE